MSRRHEIVLRLFKLSILAASLFGGTSIVFSIAESQLNMRLDQERAIEALRATLTIDRILWAEKTLESEANCNQTQIVSCTKLVESAIELRNRLKDYSILLDKTLGYKNDSKAQRRLRRDREQVDEYMHERFGLSFASAKRLRIQTADDYISYLFATKTESTSSWRDKQRVGKTLDHIFSGSANYLETNVVQKSQTSGNTKIASSSLQIALYSAIALEVVVFLLVSVMDILNNNADPGEGNEIGSKMQPKTGPLIVSIFFALITMGLSQVVLAKSQEKTLLSHCREINKQNVIFLMRLDAKTQTNDSRRLISLVKPNDLCRKLVQPWLDQAYTELDRYSVNSALITHEVASQKLRLLADAYQDGESFASAETNKILLAILVANVATMVSLAVFLRYDSMEIG